VNRCVRLRSPGGSTFLTRIAPDIAVEIFSPGDRRDSLDQKIALYLRHGSRVVLVIDPATRMLTMHRTDGSTTAEARSHIAVPPYDDLVLDMDELFRGI
jgi:Uma2 family endonuclease